MIRVYQGPNSRRWYWQIETSNGRTLAASSDSYLTRSSAQRSAKTAGEHLMRHVWNREGFIAINPLEDLQDTIDFIASTEKHRGSLDADEVFGRLEAIRLDLTKILVALAKSQAGELPCSDPTSSSS